MGKVVKETFGDHHVRDRSFPPRHARSSSRWLIGMGSLLIVASVLWQGHATLWMAHSHRVGHLLIQKIQRRITTTRLHSAESPASSFLKGPQAALEIPTIGLMAPVESGTGVSQLSVAVGHNSDSVWPGQPGTAVLAAHDVSYFVHIDELRVGNVIRYATPGVTYIFSVTKHVIVPQGTPVPNTVAPTVVLVTCWPTNALWFTPDRYLVYAKEVQVQRTLGHSLDLAKDWPKISAPTVPAPPALTAEGLTLSRYAIPMGTLTIRGAPSARWAASPKPLADASAGVEAFIGGMRSAVADQSTWWHALAPGVGLPAPLVGSHYPTYLAPLSITLMVAKTQCESVRLQTAVAVTGGHQPGSYLLTVREIIRHGQLLMTGWTMQSESS